ncbi:MAG: hypothetical protein LBI14_04650 [Treponema sp.]|nr:hypothetical protein [Treponema sp.]
MNAPSGILALRKRGLWEALDSGILLWKDNFFYFIPFFAIPVWIAAFALLFIPYELRWLSWFGLWWLKPLFDRLCLQVISSRFFRPSRETDSITGTTSSSMRTILKGIPRNFFPYLLGDILWRRFSPFRSTNMCVRLLERLKPKQYKERKKVLVQGGLNYSALLSFLALPLEAILLGGEYIFVLVMAEFFVPGINWDLLIGEENIMLILYAAYCVNYILVESLCVSMGFGLYINCRNETEGWDIQLLFQKFAQNSSKILKAVVLCVGLFVGVFLYADANSEMDQLPSLPFKYGGYPLEPREYFPPNFMPLELVPMESLEEILSSDDFGGTTPSWRIVEKKRNEEIRDLPQINLDPWLKKMKEYLALALRAFIVLVLAGFIVFALIRLKILKRSGQTKKIGRNVYANPFVSGERPEALFDKADDYFQRGLVREAWASCLCGAISAYNQYMDMSFPPDATEYNCLELVRSYFKQEGVNFHANEFGDLVRNWVLLAYGGRNPADGSFEKALEFGKNIRNSADSLEAQSE